MKVVIKRRFRDVDTGQIMYVGNIADYEQGRAMKLERSGFVKCLEKAEEETGPEPEKMEGEFHTPKNEMPEPKRRGRKPKK